jgi:hypothetical protein
MCLAVMLKVQYPKDIVDVFFPIQTSGIQLNFAKDAKQVAHNVGAFREALFMKAQNFATLLTRHARATKRARAQP